MTLWASTLVAATGLLILALEKMFRCVKVEKKCSRRPKMAGFGTEKMCTLDPQFLSLGSMYSINESSLTRRARCVGYITLRMSPMRKKTKEVFQF